MLVFVSLLVDGLLAGSAYALMTLAFVVVHKASRLATGFVFTAGPLWHPEGYYFVDVRASKLYRVTPGRPPETLREQTGGGNRTTFDL